ncbi:MAG: preprotein translocase subunit SecG [Hyphomicrobium sp.]
MQTVLLVLHLMIAAALVGVVLLQKSEGGALGIGGGGGFMSGRGQANLLTRVTAALALAFFISSIGLSLVGKKGASPVGSVFDKATAPAAETAPAAPATDGSAPAAPAPGTPVTGEPAAPRGGILDKLQ